MKLIKQMLFGNPVCMIGKRKDDYYNVLLFQVDGFYAEIYYHSHFNVIIKIKTFSDTSQLEPYLQAISVADSAPNLIFIEIQNVKTSKGFETFFVASFCTAITPIASHTCTFCLCCIRTSITKDVVD